MKLHPGDDRFNKIKKQRIYACDGCGELVGFTSWNQATASSREGDFLGSYTDQSWKDLEGILQREAYELGLIDARWFCQRVCGAQPTGAGKDNRRSRPQAYRERHWHSQRSRSPNWR